MSARVEKTVVASLGIFACFAAVTAAGAQEGSCTAPKAIRYLERPEEGPSVSTGRALATNGGASLGVDINSKIDIQVDSHCLRQALSPDALTLEDRSRYAALTAQVSSLRAAVDKLPGLMTAFDQAQRAYAASVARYEPDSARAVVRSFARAFAEVRSELQRTIEARLTEESRVAGAATAPAQRDRITATVNSLFLPVLADPRGGYNFERLQQLFEREIAAATAARSALPSAGIQMEIRAYLIPRNGEAVPIFLRNYNSAATGPDTRFGRVTFAASPEEAQLHAHFDSLARSLQSVQGLGAAVVARARAQFGPVRTDVSQTLADLRSSLTAVETKISGLNKWSSRITRDNWINAERSKLAATPDGQAVIDRWADVDRVASQLVAKFDAIRSLTNLQPQIAQDDPESVVSAVLGAVGQLGSATRIAGSLVRPAEWRSSAATITAFAAAVQRLTPDLRKALEAPGGPVNDFLGVRDAAAEFERTLTAMAHSPALEWLVGAMGGDVPRAVAELPIPPGQQRLRLSADLNTTVNLRTIPVRRAEGDVVQLSYAFYAHDQPISGGWQDEFRLRAYGFLAHTVAGLAFVQRDGEGTSSPTASLSWLATWRAWPTTGADGLGSTMRSWGAGLTTMSLNFDSAQKVQIGLALTLSAIDDRVQIGYGRNLQVKDRSGFLFVSLRLFSASGALGGRSTGQ